MTLKEKLIKNALRSGFYLVCTRAGRRHYCSGFRADEGKWTKFRSRAMMFVTREQAQKAKGRSRAEIIKQPRGANFPVTKPKMKGT
jgi:hypothetical protein